MILSLCAGILWMLLRNFPWLTAQVRLTVFHVGVHSEAPGHDEVAKLTWEKKSSNVKSPKSTSFGGWFSTISECFLGKFVGQNPSHRRFLEAKPLNHQTQTLRQILDPFSGRFQCLETSWSQRDWTRRSRAACRFSQQLQGVIGTSNVHLYAIKRNFQSAKSNARAPRYINNMFM